jgi:hypothetical protein
MLKYGKVSNGVCWKLENDDSQKYPVLVGILYENFNSIVEVASLQNWESDTHIPMIISSEICNKLTEVLGF